MKAAVLTSLSNIEMQERPTPTPGPGDALVRIRCVGVCGSDLHFFEHGRIGNDFVVTYPLILGHESAGEVMAVGAGVTHLKPGDNVALEPGITCGHCEYCMKGLYNLCPEVVFFAAPPVDGTLCEYVSHPASLCFKLPEGVSYAAGALVEPLAVALHAANQAGASLGKVGVVTGAGCIGLCSLLALKAMGVDTVVISDVVEKRLDAARALGGIAVNAAKTDLADEVRRVTGGRMADLLIESSGNAGVQAQAPKLVMRGGVVSLVGLSPEPVVPMDLSYIINNEVTIKSVFRYRNLYPTAISAIAAGLPIERIVTNTYDFGETQRAFHESSTRRSEIVKSVVTLD